MVDVQGNTHRQTKQFRLSGITLLHDNTTRLDPHLLTNKLYKLCAGAIMSISNQKYRKRSQVIHQKQFIMIFCPICAIIRRVYQILANTSNPNTIIGSTYFKTSFCKGRNILTNDINQAIKSTIIQLGLVKNGLHQDLVGSHSLRVVGALAMHLQEVDPNTIKKIGSWSSDTLIMYIHEQMPVFLAGVSHKMSTTVRFHNIAFQPATLDYLPFTKRHGQLSC